MNEDNPLLQAWSARYGLPPFDAIEASHFVPAFERAFGEHAAEIERIASNPAAPDFDNTIAAFDRSGRLLARIAPLFFNLASSETSPALQAVEREIAPRMAAHESPRTTKLYDRNADEITLDEVERIAI